MQKITTVRDAMKADWLKEADALRKEEKQMQKARAAYLTKRLAYLLRTAVEIEQSATEYGAETRSRLESCAASYREEAANIQRDLTSLQSAY
jgi:hypothetical protein